MDEHLRDDLRRAYALDTSRRDARPLAEWRLREREAFLAELRGSRLELLLELGAGVGRDARFFANHGRIVTCIDLSEAMVAECHAKGLTAHVMDVVALAFDDASFDAAYSVNCLLHLPGDELLYALTEIQRVLRPGALFYYGTWGGFEHEGIYEEDHLSPPRLFSFHNDAALQRIVSEVFEIVRFRSDPRDPKDSRFRFQSLLLRKPSTG
jgi:SAM-dependent methyltransferase